MRAALSVLGVVTVATLANTGFVAPVASGYIYRSDNNGPASLIQLGPLQAPYQQPQLGPLQAHYQQPHAFAPPLPLVQPHKALETYDLLGLGPAPLSSEPLLPAPLPIVAPQPIAIKDGEDEEDEDTDEEDIGDDDDNSEEYLDSDEISHQNHGHAYEKGSGEDFDEHHHAIHGEKGSKGYSSKDHQVTGASGSYGKGHAEGFYSEADGEEKEHIDEADIHGKHHEVLTDKKGEDHGHKKHFSKGEDVTGYHKVFHKDEFKKDHDFYDVAHKGGHFKKYDNEQAQHGSKGGAHKKGDHHDGGYDAKEHGKAGFHVKAHKDESGEKQSAEEGDESHYSREEDYGKKGGSEREKEYEYEDEDD